MRLITVSACSILAVLTPIVAIAASPSRYENARFGFGLDVPEGFGTVSETAGGDIGISRSQLGNAELRVWGGYLVDDDFKSEMEGRLDTDRQDGWDISYQRVTAKNASWSGSRGARILYERAVRSCGNAAIHFRLEYDRAALDDYNAVVTGLVKSFKDAC